MQSCTPTNTGLFARHRGKLAWIGGIFGSTYFLYKYGQYKWEEFQQERERDLSARANIKRRFEQNLHDCSFVISSLLPNLSENILSELNVERLTLLLQQIKQGSSSSLNQTASTTSSTEQQSSSKTKLELWEDVKLDSFTRVISSIYLVSLLGIFTHVQLALLGREMYLDSVVELSPRQQFNSDHEMPTILNQLLSGESSMEYIQNSTSNQDPRSDKRKRAISDDIERQYLTFSWYLLNIGWKRCVDRVRVCSKRVLSEYSLKHSITFPKLVEIIERIRRKIEVDENEKPFSFYTFLLPEEGHENVVLQEGGIGAVVEDGETAKCYLLKSELKNLLDETRDFIESYDMTVVLSSCLHELFECLYEQCKPTFYSSNVAPVTSQSTIEESRLSARSGILNLSEEDLDSIAENSKSLPLAGVLPLITKSAHWILNGVPNMFLDSLSSNEKLRVFSTIAYSSWE